MTPQRLRPVHAGKRDPACGRVARFLSDRLMRNDEMGLDITWYRGLTAGKPGEGFDADGDILYDEDWIKFYANPDFIERAAGIDSELAYKAEESDDFRAGSYGGYNAWRNQLAKVAGYPATPYARYGSNEDRHDAGAWAASEGPFYELIHFSDCEGTIGPIVAAKLAKDFADFQDRADAEDDEYFRERYRLWRNAFEKAADNGAVDFH